MAALTVADGTVPRMTTGLTVVISAVAKIGFASAAADAGRAEGAKFEIAHGPVVDEGAELGAVAEFEFARLTVAKVGFESAAANTASAESAGPEFTHNPDVLSDGDEFSASALGVGTFAFFPRRRMRGEACNPRALRLQEF